MMFLYRSDILETNIPHAGKLCKTKTYAKLAARLSQGNSTLFVQISRGLSAIAGLPSQWSLSFTICLCI